MENFVQMSLLKKVLLISLGLLVLILVLTSGRLIEVVDNSEVVVIQSLYGNLEVKKTAGPVWQGYGKATHYLKRGQYWFSKHKDEGDTTVQSIKIRFMEGGHATLSGSVSYYIPMADADILNMHTFFGSREALETQLVKQAVTKAVYMTGPLMSSKESSAEKRTDLLSFIEDQAMNGIYKTKQEVTVTKDDLTGVEKTITLVKIVNGKDGLPERREISLAKKYKLTLDNLTINSIDYDADVEAQIKSQQRTTMMIQQAIADSKKAEQDVITAENIGKAAAAKAKWDQEVLKATAITQAQQAKEVAALDAQTAEFASKQIRIEADANSYKNAKLVAAGLSPIDRAEYEMKTKIGVATAIAGITLPTNYFVGAGGSGQASILESILSTKLLGLDGGKGK